MRAFDLRAREVTDALADLRSAQQAYVAAGQGVAFWMPKVDQTLDAIVSSLSTLHQSATDAAAKRALDRSRHHARRVQHGRQADPQLHHVRRRADGGRHRVHRRRRGGGDGGTASRGGAHPGTSGSRCLRSGAAQTGNDGDRRSRGAVAAGDRGARADAGEGARSDSTSSADVGWPRGPAIRRLPPTTVWRSGRSVGLSRNRASRPRRRWRSQTTRARRQSRPRRNSAPSSDASAIPRN